MTTLNKVNKAIEKHGVMLQKGTNYFYFMGIDANNQYKADAIESVYSPFIRCMTVNEWLEYVEQQLESI